MSRSDLSRSKEGEWEVCEEFSSLLKIFLVDSVTLAVVSWRLDDGDLEQVSRGESTVAEQELSLSRNMIVNLRLTCH